MKTYIIRETITQTTTTEYKVEANSKEEARETYRENGQYLGDCISNDRDGIVIVEIKD